MKWSRIIFLVSLGIICIVGLTHSPKPKRDPKKILVPSRDSFIIKTRTGKEIVLKELEYSKGWSTFDFETAEGTIEVSNCFSDIRKFEIIEPEKSMPNLDEACKDASPDEDMTCRQRVFNEYRLDMIRNPEKYQPRVRLTYNSGDVIEGVPDSFRPQSEYLTGVSKFGEMTIDMENVLSIEREMIELKGRR